MSCSRIISEKGLSSTTCEPLTLSSMCPTSAPQISDWRHADALLPATAISAGTDTGGPYRDTSDRSHATDASGLWRSEEHTSELQSHVNLVCRLLLEKKKKALGLVTGGREEIVLSLTIIR